MSDKRQGRCPFTAEEDAKLSKLVRGFSRRKEIDWNYVSQMMDNRNARQCKDRWMNYLDTKINHKDFTKDENFFILQKVSEFGKKWKVIAAMMENRTEVSVKSQYRKLIRRHATLENVYKVSTSNSFLNTEAINATNTTNYISQSDSLNDSDDEKLSKYFAVDLKSLAETIIEVNSEFVSLDDNPSVAVFF